MRYFAALAVLCSCILAFDGGFYAQKTKDDLVRKPVDVELFVMSKCPDAVKCESVFKDVLKQNQYPINFDVKYIGNFVDDDRLEVECQHGPSECRGNIQELCFREVYPEDLTWFDFILCLNDHYKNIGNGFLAQQCAEKFGKSYIPVRTCSTSAIGKNLLRASVAETQSRGVSTSCSIYIDHKLRCIHDSEWKNCTGGHEVRDFVESIAEAYWKSSLRQ